MNLKSMISALFAAVSFALLATSSLFAQGSVKDEPKAPTGTKVAVINVTVFFQKYWRAQEFRRALEKDLEPFKQKGKKIRDQIEACEAELRGANVDAKRQDELKSAIDAHKRGLEDLSSDLTRLIAKQQEGNTVQLWNDLQYGIDAVAKAYGFQIVLGYGDATMEEFPMRSIDPKKAALNERKLVPLWIHGSVDITEIVIRAASPLGPQRTKKPGYTTSEKEGPK